MNTESQTLLYCSLIANGLSKASSGTWARGVHAVALVNSKRIPVRELGAALHADQTIVQRDLSSWFCHLALAGGVPKGLQPQVLARLLHEALWVASQVEGKQVHFLGEFNDKLSWPQVLVYTETLAAHCMVLSKKAMLQ